MISQSIKDWYWTLSGPLCWANLQLKRIHFKRSSRTELLLNIGSGEEYVEGFLNIEGNFLKPSDLWLNIHYGLPFRAGQVRAIYLSHVLEHFPFQKARSLLQECRRVLSSAGGIRIMVPSLEKAIEAYQRGDRQWFSNFPESFDSLGGRFSNHLLCQDQHRLLLDRSFMSEIAEKAGFERIQPVSYNESELFDPETLQLLEGPDRKEFCESSLIVEAFCQ